MKISRILAPALLVLALSVGAQERQRPEVEGASLILRPHGFEPSEVTLTAGQVQLKVYNRVGLPELDLLLEQEDEGFAPRTQLVREKARRDRVKWSNIRTLGPGTYILSEVTNPKWTCTITVVPASRN